MELAWLEDFLEIVATRNFSTAAAARHISQSAFSRRIKALEAWLGTELIDRSTYPVRLSPAGTLFLPRAQDLVSEIYRVRTDCRSLFSASDVPLTFSALHTLAIYFFPQWFRKIGALATSGALRSSMEAGDFLGSIEQLSLGKCDFALVYHHPDGLPVLETGPFESIQVGSDRLILVCGCDQDGKPLYSVEETNIGGPIPYLAYSWNDGYLGKLIALILSRRPTELPLSTIYESSLAEGLKQMAIAGAGIAWLPQICVRHDLEVGRLAQIGGPQMTIKMEIRLFRRSGNQGLRVEEFWQELQMRDAQARGTIPIRP